MQIFNIYTNGPPATYHTTGLPREHLIDLCAVIYTETLDGKIQKWPPILGLLKSLIVTLTYLRRNRVQEELAETFSVSQPTISRAISVMTPILGKTLGGYVPAAEDLDEHTQYIVDGTLLPCWSWRHRPTLYSGNHQTTGMKIQLACTLKGRLAWISDPTEGNRHDSYCLHESGVLHTLNTAYWIGDKGYIGKGVITPIRKPACRDLLDWEKEYNKQINKIRYHIEKIVANFKAWRIMHTDYRRPIKTFSTTISAVIALHFYVLAE